MLPPGRSSCCMLPAVLWATLSAPAVLPFTSCSSYLPGTAASDLACRLTAAPLPCTALQARGLSSALSAASAVCDHVHDWLAGTPRGGWVSMGVVSDGSYGITPGLVFSYPVTCSKGSWSIVKGGWLRSLL
jgi:hypothetical protein